MSKFFKCSCLTLGLIGSSLAYAYAPVESRDDTYQVGEAPAAPSTMGAVAVVPAQQQVSSEPGTDQQRLESLSRLDDLQTQVQSLRGQVEQQQHQIDQLQLVQREMYSDMDNRLKQMVSSKPATTERNASAAPTSQPALTDSEVLNQQQLYQKAYDDMSTRHYSEAKAALQTYLQKYPQGVYAVNAHYWLGELNLMGGDNQQASREFTVVIQQYPKSQKVADANLKLGFIAYDAKQWADAQRYLQQVVTRYPNSAAAQLANQRLAQMKREGH